MDLGKRLRSRGYRVTPQREVIYRVLQENEGKPLSLDDIHSLACEKRPGLGLTTVYRTLDLFRELEVALPVHLHGDSQYYEINEGKHHHHMVCLSCGDVELLEACLIEEIEDIVRDGSDFMITGHCMSLFGYCPDCLERGRGKGSR
ncbi:MAG: transcriptional repressor [Actinobacteria bacterium]|jgi:Fur family ferric uptake transcriptional regulator|nr:MAG: transcriptional repressor [Actinomycetota bacterium]